MALADILRRIGADADSEAEEIVQAAEEEAERLVAESKAGAEELRERMIREARERAELDRETALANARLRARDRTLAARLELTERALRKAENALAGPQDDGRYAEFLARGVIRSARGGETVRVASGDAGRLEGVLGAAVDAAAGEAGAAVELTYGQETGEIPHGLLLVGERMSVEVSPAATVRERREEMMALVAKVLFGDDAGAVGDVEAAGEGS